MEDYNNHINPNNNQDNNNQDNNNRPEQENRNQDYRFWAEQMPNQPYTDQYQYSWDNSYMNNNATNYQQEENKKPKNKVLVLLGKAVLFGCVAGLCFVGVMLISKAINPDISINSNNNAFIKNYEIKSTDQGTVKTTPRSEISDVVSNTIPSIVSINSISTETGFWFGQQFDQDVEGSGSGIIVGKDEQELLIATNNHVVAGTNKITVTFIDNTKAEAVIKGTDAAADLAVISVDISTLDKDTVNAIKIAKLGDSDDINVGEIAIAIGNALGYGQSVTVGYISAKDREVSISDGYNYRTMVLLQTDAAINRGNSGGALLNINGEVIGINSVKYSSDSVEGMGFAIPISRATPIITELMSREILKESEQGYLGIAGTDITEDISQQLKMPIGVYIGELVEGGAAQKAGLRVGDVITGINDIEITSITQMKDYVTSFRVGTDVEVKYMRSTDGSFKEDKMTVTLGSNPNLKSETNKK